MRAGRLNAPLARFASQIHHATRSSTPSIKCVRHGTLVHCTILSSLFQRLSLWGSISGELTLDWCDASGCQGKSTQPVKRIPASMLFGTVTAVVCEAHMLAMFQGKERTHKFCKGGSNTRSCKEVKPNSDFTSKKRVTATCITCRSPAVRQAPTGPAPRAGPMHFPVHLCFSGNTHAC